MPICKCPAAAALPSVGNVTCPESFGQIQKVAFQRLDGVPFFIFIKDEEEGKSVKKLAAWTEKISASDKDKIVISPYIEAPTAEGGAARTFGGGNETLGGIEMIVGRETTQFTGVIRRAPQSIIKALKDLQCESWGDNLGVYLFDENGNIGCIQKEGTPDSYNYAYPIPIRSLFFGDKTLGGFEAPDSNAVQWSFLPNWSDDLVIITPEFNPLTDLKNA